MAKAEEKDDFTSFVSTALRRPRKGILQHSLSQHLALSVSAAPLNKIRYICEAALLLDSEQRKAVGIDHEQLEVIYAVNSAFQKALKQKHTEYIPYSPWYGEHINIDYHSIIWGFNESPENYERYIEPWRQGEDVWYQTGAMPLELKARIEAIRAELKDLVEEADQIIDKIHKVKRKLNKKTSNPKAKLEEKLENLTSQLDLLRDENEELHEKWFYISSKYLTPETFNTLENQYVNWAMPKVQAIFAKLSQFVDPRLYSEILKDYMKEGREEHASGLGEG